MNDRIKQVLDGILERFKNGNIPEAVACSMFPMADDIPSANWSLLNRILMFVAGTADARGYRQWRKANRYVKKGSKGFHILVPCMKKVEDEETGEEAEALVGFMCRPVFRYEDTDGEPLAYEQIELPELPLLDRAREWGLNVRAIPGNYRCYGYYSSKRKEIALATPEEKTFFHELSHAAHDRVQKGLKSGQDPFQEIVAELSAQALCHLVGKQVDDSLGNSFRYIESYAEKEKLTPHGACLKVMNQTEKVLKLILKKGHNPSVSLPEASGATVEGLASVRGYV
ncbi:conserved hypothetical protein [uncultured Desulfatiglans sp.]|uniref:N-terminal domain-containing protein n=1 Tax=Uncultured Desulfatiglans sp. TaxID=1748965 RepID=A0A653AAH9_UNCDX|nr:conserved hypothetical protein [uncultured Desulfatiglans sp.]